jgi:hypothetical protein
MRETGGAPPAEPPGAAAAPTSLSLTMGSTAAQLQKHAAAAASDPGVSERGGEYSTKSFGLTQYHPLRLFTIRLVENAWFDRVVLVLILANCHSSAATYS